MAEKGGRSSLALHCASQQPNQWAPDLLPACAITPAAPARRVVVVSNEFGGKRLVQRHQMIYKLLDDEIKAGVHALSMETKTPEEAGL